MARGRPLVCSIHFTLIFVFAQHLIVPKHYGVQDKCFGRFPAVSEETLTAADDARTLGSGKLIKGCGRHIGSFIFQRSRHIRFAKARIQYYANGYSTFNYGFLCLCGDIIPTPGPKSNNICPVCNGTVEKTHRAVNFEICSRWCHIKCGRISVKQYRELNQYESFSWSCPTCMNILQQLPFANASFCDSDAGFENISNDDIPILPGYQELALKYAKNFRMGHINANSIAGFKFDEIRLWLESNYFDLLVVTETKIDNIFSNGQFHVNGFRMLRNDRTRGGGGIAMFIRSNVPFMRAKKLENLTGIETLAVRVKLAKSWITVVGLYRPPSLIKSIWRPELQNILETATMNSESVFCLGNFNCDMLDLNRPPKDGRDLLDIMDIFDFENLTHEATRVTKTSESLLDLIITNSKSRVLQAGVVNPQISDHALVYAILRASAPTSRSQKIHFRNLKNFNIDNFCSDLKDAPFITIMNCFEDVDDIIFAI